jgi:hypothetical protein
MFERDPSVYDVFFGIPNIGKACFRHTERRKKAFSAQNYVFFTNITHKPEGLKLE